jgi:hypothetical protein
MNRDEFWSEVLPKHATIAELGVFLGEFADVIRDLNQPRQLDLVDTWPRGPFTSGDANGKNLLAVSDLEAVYHRLAAKYRSSPNVALHRMSSIDFLARGFQTYQAIYIDTVHDYWMTSRELAMSAKRLVPGGWIGGHDLDQPGVQKAVDDFRKAHDVQAVILTSEACPSFYLKMAK